MQPWLVLIDHDNCLTPTDGSVNVEFFKGLTKLWQISQRWGRQIPFGFCTGRDRNYVEAATFFTGLAAFPNSWSVIESGVELFNAATKERRVNPALTKEVEAVFREIRAERLPKLLKEHPEFLDYPGNFINIALELQPSLTPIEYSFETVREAFRDLEEQGLIVIHHSGIAVDISPVGADGTPIDKASGVKFLAQVAGIEPSTMLGIGDSQGDFPMMNLVRFVGCPSNASQACKDLVLQKGGYISPLPLSQGVADVICHFLEGSS